MPRLGPVPPVPFHQVTKAFIPSTPFAVRVVVAFDHIGLAAAVAEVIVALTFEVTVTLASVADPQSSVTLA